MHFDTGEIGHGEHLLQQRADIVEMRKNPLGILVTFAAENFISVDGKSIEKIPLLARTFLDEARKRGFDWVQVSGVHFKVRVQADER